MLFKKKRALAPAEELLSPTAELLTETIHRADSVLPIDLAEYDVKGLASLSKHMLSIANDPEYTDAFRVHRFATHLLCEQEIKRRTASAAAVDHQVAVDA